MYRPKVDLTNLKILVVDSQSLSRSVLVGMLRELGATNFTQVTHPVLARKYLVGKNADRFDLIICDYHFDAYANVSMTGQDLLQELRQSRGLPMSTAFIMITDEARYQYVADSIEGALDDYILKPFSIEHFEKRIEVVLSRKRALADVFAYIEDDDYESAANLCEQLFYTSHSHKIYAARIGAELFIRMNKPDKANQMFEAVLTVKALPWAKLGLAKIQLEYQQGAVKAGRALESLISECPQYADAYDVLGRSHIESLSFEDAYKIFEKAINITPGSISRLQKFGSLAMLLGKNKEAKKALDMAVVIGGSNSPALDFNTMFLLSLLGYDAGEVKAWEQYKKRIDVALVKYSGSFRLKMIKKYIETIECLSSNNMSGASGHIKEIAKSIKHPQFDFEMGANFLHILVRTAEKDIDFIEVSDWVTDISNRFCVSKASSKIMQLTCEKNALFYTIVSGALQGIGDLSKEALGFAIEKDYEKSLRYLVEYSKKTLNARLFATTRASLERYQENVSEEVIAELSKEMDILHSIYSSYGTHAQNDVKFKALKAK